jgi:biopolymer transport protein ExbD
MIEFDEHMSKKNGVDLTPMIDVVFLLLIFFLLTFIFASTSIPIHLPESETSSIKNEPEVSVMIKMDGSVSLNGTDIKMRLLYQALSDMYSGKPGKDLNLICDKGVPFGKVVEVMDIAKKAGAENISVLTERKK